MSARAALALALLLLAAPAAALDLGTVLCACSDDATTHGDRQSCLAMLTQRLVDNGSMTARERARLLRRPPPPVPPPPGGCLGAGAAPTLQPLDHGFGVEADSAYYPVGGTVQAELRLWNETSEPASMRFFQVDERGCWWDLLLRDETGAIVHVEPVAGCGDFPLTVVLAPGETWARAAALPLETRGADSGVPDGLPLAPGVYWLEGIITGVGTPSMNHAVARLPIRVE